MLGLLFIGGLFFIDEIPLSSFPSTLLFISGAILLILTKVLEFLDWFFLLLIVTFHRCLVPAALKFDVLRVISLL